MAQCGLWLTKGQELSDDCTIGNRDGAIVDSYAWLDTSRANSWEIVQSVAHMPAYAQTLVMLTAEALEDGKDWLDSIEDSIDQLPHW
jgi:hypothetical protein